VTNLAGEIIRASDEPDVDMLRAYISANTSVTSTSTGFSFTKQSTNGGNIALSSGNRGFVAPRAGLYVVNYSFRTARNTSGDPVFQFRQNASGSDSGGTQIAVFYANPLSATAGNYTTHGRFSVYLAASDTIEGWHVNAAGTMSNWISGSSTATRFEVYRVPGTALTS
jgi:hypothetical protein